MKEAIGGISLFQIVILFVLVFTAVMCLTINHSRAFGVKDEVITIIENETIASRNTSEVYNLSDETIEKIIEHLNGTSYRVTGDCPSGEGWIGYDRNYPNSAPTNTNATICIRAHNVASTYTNDAKSKCSNDKCKTTNGDYPSMVYYEVVLFYQLDLPIIKQVFNLNIKGSTKVLFG